MGEANIRYARGDKEDAILMCMEIIRQGGCKEANVFLKNQWLSSCYLWFVPYWFPLDPV